MTDKTSLGDRMKRYEQPYRFVLPRRTYTVLRVDGRAFHSLLRRCERPFDTNVMATMDCVAMALCNEVQGAKLAFVQSDEVSVLYTDFDTVQTQPWFGGVLAKQVSVGAAVATRAFNEAAPQFFEAALRQAEFDARVFTLSDPVEVANYFLWRQQDATRNSILMAGQRYYSHAQLQGKNTGEIQEMLWSEHQINWGTYPDGFKRGRVCIPSVDGGGWRVAPAPIFITQPGTFLAGMIPPMPNLHDN